MVPGVLFNFLLVVQFVAVLRKHLARCSGAASDFTDAFLVGLILFDLELFELGRNLLL